MIFVLILSPQSTARLLPLRCSQKSRQAGRETWRIFRGFYLRAVVLAATLALEACIGNAVAQQPRMYAVLDAQRTARAELIAATPNKGGHRAGPNPSQPGDRRNQRRHPLRVVKSVPGKEPPPGLFP